MQLVCSTGCCNLEDRVELTDRESSVCDLICASQEPISFTQLKESTNLHQEIVSRLVRRLTIHGLVSKVEGKYKGECCKQEVAARGVASPPC
jgi:DNA-binding HxlR family transcriptional regulator